MLIKRKTIENEVSQRKPRHSALAPVNLSEEDGVRYLHFGTPWVQGAMRIRKPDWLELEYAQQMMAWMLFIEQPQQIVQLGLGAGALTKFCHRQFPDAQVTAVELNPAVIAVCRAMFKLPPDDDHLQVIVRDAEDFVNDIANRRRIDVMQVDLYDEHAQGPVLDTPAFYAACSACLKPQGMLAVNLFGNHPSFRRNVAAMAPAFEYVACLPPSLAGNVVALAFKRRPVLDFRVLYERAYAIMEQTGLPARQWANGLKSTQSG